MNIQSEIAKWMCMCAVCTSEENEDNSSIKWMSELNEEVNTKKL